MQQRYYDPIAGRFLSVDPIQASAGSFNRYWYANNNPYKYIDPDGRCSKTTGSNICDSLKFKNSPNGDPPTGPFENGNGSGKIVNNGIVQRNEKVNSQIQTLRAGMDLEGNKHHQLTVTGGESYVGKDGKVRSVTNGEVINNRKSNSAHNVENGSRAIDLRATTMNHSEFIRIVEKYTDFTNNTNQYPDKHEHLGLPNMPQYACDPFACKSQ